MRDKTERSIYRLTSDFSTDMGEHFNLYSDKDGVLYLEVWADYDYEKKEHGFNEVFCAGSARSLFVRAKREVHKYWFKKYGHYIWVKTNA